MNEPVMLTSDRRMAERWLAQGRPFRFLTQEEARQYWRLLRSGMEAKDAV